MKVLLHPGAEADIAEAAEYYARAGSPRSHGRRGFSMSIFPYTVIYRASGDTLLVLVVKHDSRRPGYGNSRK